MVRTVLFATILALSLLGAAPIPASPEEEPVFMLGFKTLAGLIPDVAGAPLENEHHNSINGDGLQMTSTGLMVWRKADNWTAFTNGWWTWVNGPYGIQDRANEDRFDWEREAVAGARAAPPEELVLGSSRGTITPTATLGEPFFVGISTATPGPFDPTVVPTASPTATPVPLHTSSPIATRTARPTSSPRPSATPVPTRQPPPTRTPTATPVPTRTPTATPVPTPTVAPTATRMATGTRSSNPAGEWVTSVSASTLYYCSKNSSYWQNWSGSNRIWFDTESDLLRVYPGRINRE